LLGIPPTGNGPRSAKWKEQKIQPRIRAIVVVVVVVVIEVIVSPWILSRAALHRFSDYEFDYESDNDNDNDNDRALV
jgi:hypothetical protein